MGDYLARLMAQTGIRVDSGPNAPQHSDKSSPESPRSEPNPTPIDVEETRTIGSEGDTIGQADRTGPLIQRAPAQPNAPSLSSVSSPPSGHTNSRPPLGETSQGNGSISSLQVGDTVHTPPSAGRTNQMDQSGGYSGGGPPLFEHSHAELSTTVGLTSEASQENDPRQIVTGASTQFSDSNAGGSRSLDANEVRGYLEALSSGSLVMEGRSGEPGDAHATPQDLLDSIDRISEIASDEPFSAQDRSSSTPTQPEVTPDSLSTQSQIRELQLSIGSISVIVEGQGEDDGSTEFRPHRTRPSTSQLSSFEAEGAASRRLNRHYIR